MEQSNPNSLQLTLEELYQIVGELEITRRKQAQVIVKLQQENEEKDKHKMRVVGSSVE